MTAGAGSSMTIARERPSAPAYRADVEGLRAIAVIAVVLYHLGVPGASGGYVGVDVFFVISGFLVGGIAIGEMREGRFRLAHYFWRRARRILPALLVVLAGTLAAGAALLLPGELAAFAESLLASLGFAANVHFWERLGYYHESGNVPLIHLWSLGVEGQFYLLFPFMALLLHRRGRFALWAGLALAGAASAYLSHRFPQASFYLLPARLWELLVGVMLAITPLPLLGRRAVREALSVLGLVLIAGAVVWFDAETAFPGWRALLPCAGAAAVIAAGIGGPATIGRALALAPFRFVGRISYSLYLWHWPVIVFLLLGLPAPALSPPWQVAAVAISLVLATLTWRFVEEPCRRSTFSARRLAWLGGGGALALGLAASSIIFSGGWPGRFDERTAALAATMDQPLKDVLRSDLCFVQSGSRPFDREACLKGREGQPQVLLVGDSHAAHLWRGLSGHYRGSSILQVTAGGCRPLLGQPRKLYRPCRDLMEWALRDLAATRRFDLVILSGYWEEDDLPLLAPTLQTLRAQGQEVLLVGPGAAWQVFVPRLLALQHIRADPTIADRFVIAERGKLDRAMAEIARGQGVAYFSMVSRQCTPRCRYFDEAGRPLVLDDAHFTLAGSTWIARFIDHRALRIAGASGQAQGRPMLE